MKAWIGKSLIAIGLIHTLFGIVVFRGTLLMLLSEGLVNTVNAQPVREQAFWFLYAGFGWIILGVLIDSLERARIFLPGFLGWAFLAMIVVGVVIMPISGLWLFGAPTAAMLYRSRRPGGTARVPG
jgi:hypothetical protein